jgi:hypothetical protein
MRYHDRVVGRGEGYGDKILVLINRLSPKCYALRAGSANAPTMGVSCYAFKSPACHRLEACATLGGLNA